MLNRKTMLYKTGVEYGDYCMNYVLGCSHGCKYPCYAFMMAKRFGKVASYNEWIDPKLVTNTLDILDKEIPRLRDKIKSVQLCFTTDPFMFNNKDVINMTLEVIKKLNQENIKCIILTKGILPIELASFSHINEYGITLVSLDENFRQQMEPGSAYFNDRIECLRFLHDQGCKTWVSIEPYPTPNIIEQDIYELLNSINFVDKIIFGRLNYSKLASSYVGHKEYYNTLAQQVICYCKDKNIKYHIKEKTIT